MQRSARTRTRALGRAGTTRCEPSPRATDIGPPGEVRAPGPTPDETLVILAQGRIVDAVAAGLVIAGSAAELARHFGMSARTFRRALRELVAVGWVVVNEGPAGRLTVRWERRRHQEPVAVERRRQDAYR